MKEVFKILLVLLMLVIIVPLIMALFGETKLLYHWTKWLFGKDEPKQEYVENPGSSKVSAEESTIVYNNGSNVASIAVKKVNVDHNIMNNGLKCMKITVVYTSENMEGEYIYCMVRFYSNDGDPLKQKQFSEKYRSQNGNIFIGEGNTIPNNSCQSTALLYMPYDELQTDSDTDLLLDVSLLHYTSKTDYTVVDRTDPYSFSVKHTK